MTSYLKFPLFAASSALILSLYGATSTCLANDVSPVLPQTGTWLTQSGNLVVDIQPCKQALCGTVVKFNASKAISNPASAAAASNASLVGQQILRDFVPEDAGVMKGRFYSGENGESYNCLLSQPSPNQLQLRVYRHLPIMGQTLTWTRVIAGAK